MRHLRSTAVEGHAAPAALSCPSVRPGRASGRLVPPADPSRGRRLGRHRSRHLGDLTHSLDVGLEIGPALFTAAAGGGLHRGRRRDVDGVAEPARARPAGVGMRLRLSVGCRSVAPRRLDLIPGDHGGHGGERGVLRQLCVGDGGALRVAAAASSFAAPAPAPVVSALLVAPAFLAMMRFAIAGSRSGFGVVGGVGGGAMATVLPVFLAFAASAPAPAPITPAAVIASARLLLLLHAIESTPAAPQSAARALTRIARLFLLLLALEFAPLGERELLALVGGTRGGVRLLVTAHRRPTVRSVARLGLCRLPALICCVNPNRRLERSMGYGPPGTRVCYAMC